MRRADVDSRLALVVNSLEDVVVRLALVKTALTEIKVAADLTVVARAVNWKYLTPTATAEEGRWSKVGRLGAHIKGCTQTLTTSVNKGSNHHMIQRSQFQNFTYKDDKLAQVLRTKLLKKNRQFNKETISSKEGGGGEEGDM